MAKAELSNDDHAQVCLLLDFYRSLLTPRTREVLDLYFDWDLSLAEIAENLGISRQAVHDKVRLGTAQLLEWDAKLDLMQQHQTLQAGLGEALRLLTDGQNEAAQTWLRQLKDKL